MVEELFSVLALGLEISVWLFITCMVLIKRRRRSIWMRLLSLFMIVGYFEIYEVLMFYHGEKLWLYSGLTEILMLALLIVINNEGCFCHYGIITTNGKSLDFQGVSAFVAVYSIPFPKLKYGEKIDEKRRLLH